MVRNFALQNVEEVEGRMLGIAITCGFVLLLAIILFAFSFDMLRRRANQYQLPGYELPKRRIPEPDGLTPQGRQMLTWGSGSDGWQL